MFPLQLLGMMVILLVGIIGVINVMAIVLIISVDQIKTFLAVTESLILHML